MDPRVDRPAARAGRRRPAPQPPLEYDAACSTTRDDVCERGRAESARDRLAEAQHDRRQDRAQRRHRRGHAPTILERARRRGAPFEGREQARSRRRSARSPRRSSASASSNEGVRIDGRGPPTSGRCRPRSASCPTAHGSGLFQRGETQVLNVVHARHAAHGADARHDRLDDRKRYMHHYNLPPFSTGETGRVGCPKRREIGHGAARRAGAAAGRAELGRVPVHAAPRLRRARRRTARPRWRRSAARRCR